MDFSKLPEVFTTAEARSEGLVWRHLREGVSVGCVQRRSHGFYGVPQPPDPALAHWEQCRDEHLQRVRHALRRYPTHAASHLSAAVVHGLAVTLAPGMPVHLTVQDGCPRSRREAGVVRHHSDTVQDDLLVIDGLRVTSVDRTIVDFSRTSSLAAATAVMDDALRRGLTSRDALFSTLRQQLRWVGRPRALAALSLADPRRETWLESYSFVRLHEKGHPIPLPQVTVLDAQKRFVARVDGLEPTTGGFFEADGLDKYFLHPDGLVENQEEAAKQSLRDEDARHQHLVSLGLWGVRWTTREIREDTEGVSQRILAQARSARPKQFTGFVVYDDETRQLPFDVDRPHVDFEKLLRGRRRDRLRTL